MSLDTLPPELLHALCRLCSTNDIYRLRLTSQYIKNAADEHMLDNLTIFFDKSDFCAAEDLIERDPRIAKTVTQLNFQADHLPAVYTRQDWDAFREQTILALAEEREQLESTEHYAMLRNPGLWRNREERLARESKIIQQETAMCRQSQLRKAFGSYQDLLEDQSKLVEGHKFKQLMGNLLRRCPKLDSVTVKSQNLFPGLPWQISDSLRSGMVRPWGEPSNGVVPVTDALLEAHEIGRMLYQLAVGPISPRFFNQDESLMSKIYTATNNLRQIAIRIEPDFKDAAMLQQRFSATSAQSVTMTPQLATTLMLKALEDGSVAKFLAQARTLQQLDFFGPLLAPTLPMIPLMDIVGTSPWTTLRRITLVRVQSTQLELTALLLKYSRTLREIVLGDIRLTEGEWRSCFRQIAGCFSELQNINLNLRFGDRHTPGTICFQSEPEILSQMKKFLLTGEHEPDEFPIVPNRLMPF